MRADYVAIAYAADTVAGVAKEFGLLIRGDTEEARNERLNARLQDATEELGRAILRLRLEEGTQPIVDAYARLRADWFRYADYELPGLHYSEITETLRKIEIEVVGIVAVAKADLDRLSEPV